MSWRANLAIYCADVGAIATNFGWARVDAASGEIDGGQRIDDLVDHLTADLSADRRVALGFECPLWVPLPEESQSIGKARPGEAAPGGRARPWSAGAGSGALAAGLVQVPWVLRRLRRQVSGKHASIDWEAFCALDAELFLWEAFVTGDAKGASHEDDAAIGAKAFRDVLANPTAADACATDGAVLSLIGTAMLRTAWTDDLMVLQTPPIVIRANEAGG